jgi:hypothetical protein
MKKINLVLLFTLVIALTSCGSTDPLLVNKEVDLESNTNINYVNKSSLLDDRNIELPSNYDVNNFGVVKVAAYVSSIKWDKGAVKSNIDKNIVGKLFENELARTKRFEVLTRLCSSCDSELAHQVGNTVSEGAMERGEGFNPDFIIETDIDFGMSIKKLYDHSAVIFYSVATTKLLNPTTGQVVESFAPVRSNLVEKVYNEMNGRIIAGFDYKKPEEREQAYKDAAQKSIAVIASQLMEYYPVGGRVTNYRSGRIAIDAGIAEGFAQKQPVVLFLDDDGLPIPLASAEITPTKSGSGSGLILKWRDDKDAQDVKNKIDALGKDYLKRNKVYAVSVGTPADWTY